MNQSSYRGPMMQGNFDPSLMKMGMMNPVQYQHFQQMMFMQQFQRQQMQRQSAMAAAAAAAAANANTSNIPSESQKPPTGYVCFKCGEPGHWIYYCPNVPKGQYVQRHHRYENQYISKTDTYLLVRNPMGQNNFDMNNAKPQEFTCIICDKLMTDPVTIPCCGKSYCKECTYCSLFLLFCIIHQRTIKIYILTSKISLF